MRMRIIFSGMVKSSSGATPSVAASNAISNFASRLSSRSRESALCLSSVMPRLLRLSACQVRLRSRPGISSRKGSILRPADPDSGSTTTTSASSAARMFPACIVSGAEISSTRRSLSIAPAPFALRLAAQCPLQIGFEFSADRFQIEGGRIEQALNRETAQRPYQQRGLRVGIDVSANFARLHALLDENTHHEPEVSIRGRHLGANFRYRPERLADQHIERVAIARGRRADITLRDSRQRVQSAEPVSFAHFIAREARLQLTRNRAHQRFLGAEAMTDQSVAVAGLFTDLRESGAAAPLALDQLDRGVEHAAVRGFATLALGAASERGGCGGGGMLHN